LVREAQANLSDMKNQFDLAQSVGDSRAISREELARRRFAMQAAESKLVNAQANLDLLKAGSWKADISVAQTDLEYAAAQVKATGIEIDRLTVKAPVDGEVMQLNARVAEYAQAGPLSVPLILFGNTGTLRVRVDIDENEAWRVRPNADAWAYIRGNRDLKTQLKFEHIEPYIIPKRSLTGESTERVDTRVLQVIYSFQPGKFPVYVGQQMDVNIDAGDAAKAVASK
jgi:HlyD family secretion protein